MLAKAAHETVTGRVTRRGRLYCDPFQFSRRSGVAQRTAGRAGNEELRDALCLATDQLRDLEKAR